MLHARFDLASGGLVAATAYRDALDLVYGYPRGAGQWEQHFADPFGNLAAKANPLDPSAAWAVDISSPFPLAGDDGSDPSTFVLALDTSVPFPDGATTFEWTGEDPEWNVQVIFP